MAPPAQLLTIFLLTWNMASEQFPSSLDMKKELLITPKPDIYVLGFQESNMLGFGPWFKHISGILESAGYKLLKSNHLFQMVQLIFVNSDLKVGDVQVDTECTGILAACNKGGILTHFEYQKRTFAFINSHMAAHTHKLSKRIEDYKRLTKKLKPAINKHDYAFWIGDLNFRIEDLTFEQIMKLINEIEKQPEKQKTKFYGSLMSHDQLTKVIKNKQAFEGYSEAPVGFAPTFKFIKGTDNYNPKREPSWCDRVLWHSATNRTVNSVLYRSIKEYKLSDHKPVVSLIQIPLSDTPKNG